MFSPFPVIDLFAGPGGLGEGFSSVRDKKGNLVFKIGVSIEKDSAAHETLTLRALFRHLETRKALDSYIDFIEGNLTTEEYFNQPSHIDELNAAREEAKCAELGVTNQAKVDQWIRAAIGGRTDWVLIGGPPCQAYSLAGRSRRTNDIAFEKDEKHFLYREYLRIVKKFKPAVFVMENVKGILSSTHGGSLIFSRILEDLCRPQNGLEYEIRSFVCAPGMAGHAPSDFVIRTEKFGLPQARHRVILFGVRSDFASRTNELLEVVQEPVTLDGMLVGLPKLRSHLSKQPDSFQNWLDAIEHGVYDLRGWKHTFRAEIESVMRNAVTQAHRFSSKDRISCDPGTSMGQNLPVELANWVQDRSAPIPPQHSSRRHMGSDLRRYLFAASYASIMETSPKLRDFPERLLPDHANAREDDPPHADRFRVQMRGRPSTTITSHISKDGHYYIHPDPSQCRSLTVREAARLQTFPDNYFFVGGQTQCYHQVGNAVPPYLAWKLGKVVAGLMSS